MCIEFYNFPDFGIGVSNIFFPGKGPSPSRLPSTLASSPTSPPRGALSTTTEEPRGRSPHTTTTTATDTTSPTRTRYTLHEGVIFFALFSFYRLGLAIFIFLTHGIYKITYKEEC